jgi:hypothetical protein
MKEPPSQKHSAGEKTKQIILTQARCVARDEEKKRSRTCSCEPKNKSLKSVIYTYLLFLIKLGTGFGLATAASVVSNTIATFLPWFVKFAAMLEATQ